MQDLDFEIPRLARTIDPKEVRESGKKNLKLFKPGERTVGRAKGTPNKVTQTLREAVERAARDCHPAGLAGWLVERANGTAQDRQIFAGLVGKVIPIQVNQQVNGGISINLGWLGSRAVNSRIIDQDTIEIIEPTGGDKQPSTLPLAQAEIAPPGGIQTPPGGVSRGAADSDPLPPSNPGGGVVR